MDEVDIWDNPTPTQLRVYRIEQAKDQLLRYSGAPPFDEFAQLLEEISNLNDDIYRNKAKEIIDDDVATIKATLDTIAFKAKNL